MGSVLARAIYIANLVAQCLIVVTGAVVRLTASGLGCPTWPQCVPGSFTPVAHQAQAWHKDVEFGNRLLTFALVILAIAAIVIALVDAVQRRIQRAVRRDIVALAFIPILGTVAQAVLGGITVLTGLNPLTVGAHLLVSMAIIAGTVALVARASSPVPRAPIVPGAIRALAWALLFDAAAVVSVGVIVTGSGPHAGDAASSRLSLDTRMVAWFHADLVLLLLGLTVGLLVALVVTHGSLGLHAVLPGRTGTAGGTARHRRGPAMGLRRLRYPRTQRRPQRSRQCRNGSIATSRNSSAR